MLQPSWVASRHFLVYPRLFNWLGLRYVLTSHPCWPPCLPRRRNLILPCAHCQLWYSSSLACWTLLLESAGSATVQDADVLHQQNNGVLHEQHKSRHVTHVNAWNTNNQQSTNTGAGC